jgi:hypothetical protein
MLLPAEWGRRLTQKMQKAGRKVVQSLSIMRNTLHISKYIDKLTLLFSCVCIWKINCILDERLVNSSKGEKPQQTRPFTMSAHWQHEMFQVDAFQPGRPVQSRFVQFKFDAR